MDRKASVDEDNRDDEICLPMRLKRKQKIIRAAEKELLLSTKEAGEYEQYPLKTPGPWKTAVHHRTVEVN